MLYTTIHDIEEERKRQYKKFGNQKHSPEKWLIILMEEVGEASEAVLKEDFKNYRKELIQCMAVCDNMIEKINQQLKGGSNG